jgi:tRNA (guanosine-2'-O-)-methyltransferase
VRRNDPDVYDVPAGRTLPAAPDVVIEALSPLVTPRRLARMQAVAAARTLQVVPVLEDIADPHNASAILRSADAFGVQEVHAIAGPHGLLAAHAVSKGTHRWLDIQRHDTASDCIATLHERGFEIVVAAMDGRRTPEDLRAMPKVAIVFGNEHRGVTERMRELADDSYAVPMCGFAESLNVSVAAATTLYAATRGRTSELSEADRERLVARFLLETVTDAERVVHQHVASR